MKKKNTYRITNTETGEIVEKEAEYLGNAIEETGWDAMICRCEIVPVKPKRKGKDADTPALAVEREPSSEKVDNPAGISGEQTDHGGEPPVETPQAAETGQEFDNGKAEELKAMAEKDREEAASNEFSKKLQREIDNIDIHRITDDASLQEKEAWEHKQQIEVMAIEAEVMFLRMGQLLYQARIAGEWSILHYESYREYVEDIKLPVQSSYSWATRLSAIYEYMVKNMGLDEKLLAEIGVAKLTRLLPLARVGELTEDVIEAARVLSDLDLRAQLGHEVPGSDGEKADNVICPRCGEVFNARKANRP